MACCVRTVRLNDSQTSLLALLKAFQHGKAAQFGNLEIIFWECFQLAEANIPRMVTGQSAAIGRRACLLHGLFTRAADPRPARGCWPHFPPRSGRRLEQNHAANELFSRSKRCADRTEHRS